MTLVSHVYRLNVQVRFVVDANAAGFERELFGGYIVLSFLYGSGVYSNVLRLECLLR